MHLGLVTYNVARDWDLDSILKVCKDVGLDGVEFRTTHRHGVEPSMAAAERAEVRKRCTDAGLKQWSLGTVCEFHAPDRAIVQKNIETCKDFIVLAEDIGARGVKVRPNALPKEVPAERTLEQIGKALATCGSIGADHGVEIWMEVHGTGTSLPANARKIMDYCGHPNVGVTWNSNPTDVQDGSVRQSFEILRPFICCCHITDLWSEYPWRELFGLLRDASYDRFTLCEVGAALPPEAGVLFLRCYKGLWRELQR
jgi:sugar phosphate isomerase/epimerase